MRQDGACTLHVLHRWDGACTLQVLDRWGKMKRVRYILYSTAETRWNVYATCITQVRQDGACMLHVLTPMRPDWVCRLHVSGRWDKMGRVRNIHFSGAPSSEVWTALTVQHTKMAKTCKFPQGKAKAVGHRYLRITEPIHCRSALWNTFSLTVIRGTTLCNTCLRVKLLERLLRKSQM